MFETAKTGRAISREQFKEVEPALRQKLLAMQLQARKHNIPVILLLTGLEGAGKGQVVNQLNAWLDTRNVQVHAFWDESDEQKDRPEYWRFWRTMPARGEISIVFGGWYQRPIEDWVLHGCSEGALERQLNRVLAFEQMITEDGLLLVKLWFHFSRDTQRKRLKKLKRDDRSRWKMFPAKSDLAKHYSLYEQVAERIMRVTDNSLSPWHVVEAADARYRDLTTATILADRIQRQRELNESQSPVTLPPKYAPLIPEAEVTVLDRLDLDRTLDKDDYKRQLPELQEQLNELIWDAYKAKRSTVVLMEGVDAAGKGGAIRRLIQSVDARLYRVIPVAAPTDEEQAHHYLWRFWRHIPRAGRMTIYDRSWYGRVLVERVEQITPTLRWQHAYLEINEFERQLTEAGISVIKFWLQISSQEQAQRFEARAQIPHKQHKITEEDWRNREKWDDYLRAANEMFTRTNTGYAPWTLVEANDKRYARIKVLRTVRDALKRALESS